MLLAAGGWPEWEVIAWITVAMVSARTLGMSANRLIDRHIDAQNPRTSGRHMPMGSIRVAEMAVLSVSAGAVLVLGGGAAKPSGPGVGPSGRRLPRCLSLHQAIHLDRESLVGLGAGNRTVRRLDRRSWQSELGAGAPVGGGRPSGQAASTSSTIPRIATSTSPIAYTLLPSASAS